MIVLECHCNLALLPTVSPFLWSQLRVCVPIRRAWGCFERGLGVGNKHSFLPLANRQAT